MTHVERLIALCHRRWGPPLLAELHRLEGAKFVQLAHRLGASPTAVRLTLDHLTTLGWVRRNPGYGHPLRPEYILTARGARLAAICVELDALLAAPAVREVALRKWSLPVLDAVGSGTRRFGQVVAQLGVLTDRAAALSLRGLLGAELLHRVRSPRAATASFSSGGTPGAYAATPRGLLFVPLLATV